MMYEVETIILEKMPNTTHWYDLMYKFNVNTEQMKEALDEVIDEIVDNVLCDLDPMIESYLEKHGSSFTELMGEYLERTKGVADARIQAND